MIERDQYDAVLFDLDGVLTATARLHAASWKQMFDAYLRRRGRRLEVAIEDGAVTYTLQEGADIEITHDDENVVLQAGVPAIRQLSDA